ncbi:MAG: phosphoglycerate dehydrogenase [Planctomycetota bacterium]
MTTATPAAPAAATGTFTLLAADKLSPDGLAFIEAQPDATLLDRADLAKLKADQGQEAVDAELGALLAAGGIHGMIVRSGIKVTPAVLDNPGDLKVIARAGVGVDNIDLPAATEKGILVVNTAEASTVTTAELAFTLMMSLLRNIGPAYRTMADGGWDRSKFTGRQLSGKTVGVVGFGRIGQTLADRCLAFGCDVVAYDPFINAETMLDGRVKMTRDFEAMLPACDLLSFHVPLNDATRGMLNAKSFEKCKDGVFVVNAARGGVVDEDDLLAALESGKCGGAAIDVYTAEPPPADSKLRNYPRLLTTPHLGASTKEAQQAVSIDAAKACLTYLRGEGVKGAVNAPGLKVDLTPTQERYADLAERMARLISPMITRGIASVTVSVRGDALSGAADMICRRAVIALLNDHLSDPVNLINAQQVAEARGIAIRCTSEERSPGKGSLLVIEIEAPRENLAQATPAVDRKRRIVGRVYDDLRPRVVEINGYHMDMVPAGPMCLIQNADQPGMIGVVGTTLGQAGVNIADMSISRREDAAGVTTAMQVLKIDAPMPEDLVQQMRSRDGILKIATVHLPPILDNA